MSELLALRKHILRSWRLLRGFGAPFVCLGIDLPDPICEEALEKECEDLECE